MDKFEIKNKFNSIICDIINKKRNHKNSFLTIDEYNICVEQIKHSKLVLKTPEEKNL